MKRETILKATAVFQRYMPCQQMPEIHQVTVREFERKRSELVERLQSSQDMYDAETDDSLMEFIHGEKGDAIIIKKDYFSNADEEGFANALWHELGHFVATKAESPKLRKFLEENDGDREVAYGYWFWSEFVAEAISCHVSNEYRKTRPNYHPENIKWNRQVFENISCSLSDTLQSIFDRSSIDMFSISHYFAHFLKEDFYIIYREKYPKDDIVGRSGFTKAPFDYIQVMIDLMEKLEEQLKKEEFWIVDEVWIRELGKQVLKLTDAHLAWMLDDSCDDWNMEVSC